MKDYFANMYVGIRYVWSVEKIANFGCYQVLSWTSKTCTQVLSIRGGGLLPYLGMVGRVRGDHPRFWDFRSDWVPFSASSNPSNSQARSDWPLIVLIFNPIDPLFPNFNPIDPLFLNPVRSDWVHFSSLCWASLPKILSSIILYLTSTNGLPCGDYTLWLNAKPCVCWQGSVSSMPVQYVKWDISISIKIYWILVHNDVKV